MNNTKENKSRRAREREKPNAQSAASKRPGKRREQVEVTLRASEMKYRRSFEMAQDGMLLLDAETGQITDANPCFEKMLGYSRDELVGEKLWDIGIFVDAPEGQKAFHQVNKKRYAHYKNLQLETRDGKHLNVEFVGNAYRVEGKKVIQCNIRDNTERTRAEQELLDSEEKYHQLFEAESDGLFLIDNKTGKILEVNAAASLLYGYSRKKLLSMKNTDLSAEPENTRKATKATETAEGDVVLIPLRWHRKKDGTVFPVEITGRFFTWQDRSVHVAAVRDITKRRRAEDELRASEERFRKVFEEGPFGMAVSNRQHRFIRVNTSFCRMLGYTERELMGLSFTEITHPDYIDAALENILKLNKGEIQTFRTEKQYLKKGKGVIWGSLTLSTVRDEEGEVQFYLAMIEDITERKQVDELIRRSEIGLKKAQSFAHVGSWTWDIKGNKLEWSDEMYRIFGIPKETFSGSLEEVITHAIHPDDRSRVEQSNLSVINDKKPIPLEYRIVRPDGSVRIVWAEAGELVLDEKGAPALLKGIVQDITERKQAEDALRDSEERFREVFENMSSGVVIYRTVNGGEDFRINHFNRAAEMIEKISRESVIGKSVCEAFPGVKALGLFEVFQRVWRTGEPEHHPIGFYKDDRISGWRENYVARLPSGEIVAIYDDVTERKRAEEQIQILSRFPAEDPSPILRIAPDGILLYANKSSEPLTTMWNVQIGQPVPGDWRSWVAEVFAAGRNMEIEVRCGEQLFSCILTPVVSEGYINVYGRDITGKKQVEETLAHQAEELRQRNIELSRLYQASASLISTDPSNFQSLAETIVNVVLKEFGQANCSLVIVDKNSKGASRIAIAGPYADQVRDRKVNLDGPGLIAQAIRTGQVINTPDIRNVQGYVPNWSAARSKLVIPLKVGGRVIGAIDVQSIEPNAFTDDDERLMTIFAERAALALEHGRLYGETERRMRHLATLRTIDMAITSSFNLDITLNILLEQLTSQLGIHAADILIFNPSTQMFNYACGRGFRTKALQQFNLRLGDGYAGRAARDRRVINISDLAQATGELQRSRALFGEGFVSYVCIPLIAKGQIKGVLEIFQRELFSPDQEWYDFLDTLAGQAALTIDYIETFDRLQHANNDLSLAYDNTLECWGRAVELRLKELEGHSRRLADLTLQIAAPLGVIESDLIHIYRGALLHDIGMMGVPDSIVLKPGSLTEEEMAIIRQHPLYASELLSSTSLLKQAVDIPYGHHEKWDGTGYPLGLRGDQIPLAARVFAVIDVWDALTSGRPYRKAWSQEEALSYIRDQAGFHFDPVVVKTFLELGDVRKA
jgi:PAS domain S-box-containing protein